MDNSNRLDRVRRDLPLVSLDLGIALVAYLPPLALRFDGLVLARYWSNFWRFLPVAFGIHLTVNHFCGLYDQMWRYASVQEARRTVQAGTIGGGAMIVASMGHGAARLRPADAAAVARSRRSPRPPAGWCARRPSSASRRTSRSRSCRA
jgi:hypothetical protein